MTSSPQGYAPSPTRDEPPPASDAASPGEMRRLPQEMPRHLQISGYVTLFKEKVFDHFKQNFFLSINQPGLAEATEYLIQAFYGFEAPLIKVTCQTEVSEQYHVYLQTRQQSKDMCIAAIEQYTHTTIQFPTMINSNISQDNINNYGRRTSVTITGSPTQVCQARKLFDVKKKKIFFVFTEIEIFVLALFTNYFDI